MLVPFSSSSFHPVINRSQYSLICWLLILSIFALPIIFFSIFISFAYNICLVFYVSVLIYQVCNYTDYTDSSVSHRITAVPSLNLGVCGVISEVTRVGMFGSSCDASVFRIQSHHPNLYSRCKLNFYSFTSCHLHVIIVWGKYSVLKPQIFNFKI